VADWNPINRVTLTEKGWREAQKLDPFRNTSAIPHSYESVNIKRTGQKCAKCEAPGADNATYLGLVCNNCLKDVPSVCDFCRLDERLDWKYDAEDFEFAKGQWSRGAWLACAPCHHLIEAKDFEGLLKRWAQHTNRSATSEDRETCRRTWKIFSRNRKGPAVLTATAACQEVVLPKHRGNDIERVVKTRTAWLHYAYDSALKQRAWLDYGTEKLPHFRYPLEHGATFFMDHHFCQMVEQVRRTVPDDLEFELAWLVSTEAWMLIGEPFLVPQTEGLPINPDTRERYPGHVQIRVAAIGWRTLPPGTEVRTGSGTRITQEHESWFCNYIDFGLGQDPDRGFGAWSYYSLKNGARLIDRINQFEGEARRARDGSEYIDNALHEIRWTYAAMYLMSQRLMSKVRHDATVRSIKRSVENYPRQVHVPHVDVVTLRRYQQAQEPNPNAKPMEYYEDHRIWISPYWRPQWYPSEGRHKPVMVGAKSGGFAKGNPDKPITAKQRVYVAKR